MAKKEVIKLNLYNPNDFVNAIGQLNLYQRKVLEKINLFAKTLADKGVEIAKLRITTLDAIFTGDLLNSIHSETRGFGAFAIVTDSEHCAFVEFGTGQLGAEGGYPYPFPNGVAWNYNVGETIFQISEGQYGWFYPALDGTWKFTQGMPARPFMYETALELQTIVNKTAKEVFAK